MTTILAPLIDGMQMPPDLSITDWAEANVVLPSELAAEPGPYRAGRTPYAREMMDVVLDPDIETIVYHTSAQIAKTTSMLNIVGYFIEHDPCPMLFVVPNLILDTFSKAKVGPYLNGTPVLAERCGLSGDARATQGTLYRKEFPGGFLNLAGASSAASLAMQSVRIVLADEVDRFPDRAGKEADPLGLATKRAQTFANRKIIASSTPTHKGHSKIDGIFALSDQRCFHVPLPCCGELQKLVWEQVKWRNGHPDTAEYLCPCCGTFLSDIQIKTAVLSPRARWIAENPNARRTAGFHLWQIYSPWSTLEEIVAGFEQAGTDDKKLELWTNTVLGESYDASENIRTTPEALFNARVRLKPNTIPKGACVVTAGVDVQKDRLEVLFTAWGPNKRGWLLQHVTIEGDPSADAVWGRLEAALLRRWVQEGFPHTSRPLEGVAIDSGYMSQRVYDFCAKQHRLGRPWYAVKGQPGEGRIAWEISKSRIAGLGQAKLHHVGVDGLKTEIAARLSSSDPGENDIYIAHRDEFTLERLEQLFAERVIVKINPRGFDVREWTLSPGKRNELWDLLVYADAVHRSLAIDHEGRIRSMAGSAVTSGTDIAKMFG
ncbi:MAG: phage terminase large subunit family protein [Hyphomicrobiaceae bacterium]